MDVDNFASLKPSIEASGSCFKEVDEDVEGSGSCFEEVDEDVEGSGSCFEEVDEDVEASGSCFEEERNIVMNEQLKNILNCIRSRQWQEIQFIETINKLYAEIGAFICPKVIIDKEKIFTGSEPFMCCFNIGEHHFCKILYVMIGSALDFYSPIDIRRGFVGSIKDRDYCHVPYFLCNNVKQIHLYKYNVNGSISMEPRAFYYGDGSDGYMLLQASDNKIWCRFPNAYEHILDIESLSDPLSRSLGVNFPALIEHDTTKWTDFFNAIRKENINIDEMDNKFVITYAYLLKLWYVQLRYRVEQIGNLRVKDFRTIIRTGNMAFLISKTNQIQTKSQKEIAKNILDSMKGCSTAIDTKISKGNSNTPTGTQTLFEKSYYMKSSFNRVKRCSSQKKRRTTTMLLPQNHERILANTNIGNISSAGKRMNLVYSTHIVFCLDHECGALWLKLVPLYDEHGKWQIVFNSVVTAFRSSLEFIHFYFQVKSFNPQCVVTQLGDNFIHIRLQSGILLFPLTINDLEPCTCGKMTLSRHPFANHQHADLFYDPPQGWCRRHILTNYSEIKFQYIPYYFFENCDVYSLQFGYLNNTELSKLHVSVTATKRQFIEHMHKFTTTTAHEQTQGCYAKELRLFAIFYDYENRNVEDGYVVGDHVNFNIQLTTKFTCELKKETLNQKITFIPDRQICSIPLVGHKIYFGYVLSAAPLKIESKKFTIIDVCHNVPPYRYEIYLELLNEIPFDEIEIDFKRMEKTFIIVVLIHYTTNPKYNAKIVNCHGNKGMIEFADFSNLLRENGQRVDITMNPGSLVAKGSLGCVSEQLETSERVFHNGTYVGVGGYVRFKLLNEFPWDNFQSSETGNPMRIDKNTSKILASLIPNSLYQKSTEHFNSTQGTIQLPNSLQMIFEWTKCCGKSIIFNYMAAPNNTLAEYLDRQQQK